MSTIQTAISSQRFNRLMFGLGAAVLAAGILVFVFKLAGGSDKTSFAQQPGFHPTLPARSTPLKNANGVTVKTFQQLEPEVRSTIRTFLATAVARKNLGASWAVIAPSVKAGYTYKRWKNAKALPVIPYPISNVENTTYNLDYASTKEILVDMGLTAKKALKIRPARFRLGLVPVGKGAHKRWLVDYWMPLWTPQLPVN
jgi:hypothetical protein